MYHIFKAILSILPLITLILAHDDAYSVKYTTETFSQEIGKKNHFVMFYAPWCGHCQKFAPKWEQLAEMLNDDDSNNIKIAKVDCTTDSDVCSEQDITGYPTLKFYKVGESEGIRFRGTRDLPTITTFINEQLREGEYAPSDQSDKPKAVSGLIELNEDNFEKHVAKGKYFVKFYAPWCGHCQNLAPTWEELAKSLESDSDVNIAKIDCTQYRSICNKYEVKGYPTLLWIENGDKVDKYTGGRNQDELKEYVIKMIGTKKAENKREEPQSVDSQSVSGEITDEDFKNNIQSGVAFVKFYAPWCGHCKRLSPTWDVLRGKFSENSLVKILKVDCTLEVNKQLCNDEEVEGFPSLYLYKEGEKVSEYSGSRSLEDLYDFVDKHTSRDHDEL